MRKWLSILVLALVAGTAHAGAAKKKIGLTYSLLLKQGGALVAASVLDGLESGDSFRLSIRPGQDCYAYLIVQRSPDDFRLLYPTVDVRRGKNLLHKKEEFVWPQKGWLRLDRESGTERVYLILSAERIFELEARHALEERKFPESVLLDIRDRYQSDTSYSREMDDERVRVRFKSRGLPAVLIEEITVRHM